MAKTFWLTLAAIIGILHQASGHGRLMDPVGRASAWRLGFPTPRNYDDNALFCGGFARMMSNGGKCGPCGDPWNGERENEAGGKFATGTIVKVYKKGQVINATSEVTANHNGYFEYRICPNDNPKKPVTHECLNQHVLQLADGSGTRYPIAHGRTGRITTLLKLPADMVCSQCVLQWKYHAGNSWGVDQATGRGCVGCGPQEEFYGCADVAIVDDNGSPQNVVTNPPTTPAPNTQPPIVLPLITNPPWIQPRLTNPPATDGQTKQTVAIGGNLAGSSLICHGINVWAGDPSLDKWCTDSCNQGKCPPLACDCSPTGAVTPKPTTKAPTTTTPTTTATTTTTTTTRPTTTTTTTTTTTPKPTTTSTTTSPPATKPQTSNHVVCKAINNWAGNEYLDRWCSDACARGNCPVDSCKCSLVRLPVATQTGTIAPATQPAKQCKAIGPFKGIDVFDTWCTKSCNEGNCPSASCTCISARASGGTSGSGSQSQTFAHCTSLTKESHWDSWCQDTCDHGKCARDFCTCQ